jgi:hypothetical protein
MDQFSYTVELEKMKKLTTKKSRQEFFGKLVTGPYWREDVYQTALAYKCVLLWPHGTCLSRRVKGTMGSLAVLMTNSITTNEQLTRLLNEPI